LASVLEWEIFFSFTGGSLEFFGKTYPLLALIKISVFGENTVITVTYNNAKDSARGLILKTEIGILVSG
jgi:hypothetical protein